MGKTSSNDSPKSDEVPKRKFSQEQYDMLKRCSDKKDMTEWNEWRNDVVGGTWIHLEKAYLKRFCLESASLYKVNLKGAELQEANLQGADFIRANLREADLRGADLREAELTQANMQLVKFDSRTRCSSLKGEDFYGSPVFKRFVEDADFLEDFRSRHPAIYWIWFVFSDCGRSIGLWAAWSLAFAVFYAHVFYRLGPGAMRVADLPWNFSTVVYYSVVTFTTLGFGDVVPKTNAAAWWVMAEVITGYVMLGGLISIFANKLARRS
ncbi:MAG TPA: hypothetical protein HPP87_05090 [Planctomycetes bacterium]|nr:hypothetical protein [Planctomycetota bacterium]